MLVVWGLHVFCGLGLVELIAYLIVMIDDFVFDFLDFYY